MSPPTATAVPRSGGKTSAEATSQTQKLINDAHLILINCGITMSPSKVSRLVRGFEARVARNGWEFFQFLANAVQLSAEQRRTALRNPDLVRVFSYPDPTGELAMHNYNLPEAERIYFPTRSRHWH